MGWIESLMCWFRPSHWRDRYAQPNPNPPDGPHGYTESQQAIAHDAPEFTDHDVSDPGVT